MRNWTASNKLPASAGKVHGGLTVKCDTHKWLQFTLLVFPVMPIKLKCKSKSLLLDRGEKKNLKELLIQIKVTNIKERCMKADSDKTSIVRNYGEILARGYF